MKYEDLYAWLDSVDAVCHDTFGVECALDLVENQDHGIDTLHDAFSNDVEPAEGLRQLRLLQARELWETLGDVPVVESDKIETAFVTSIRSFPPGTPVLTIWHWFEACFDCSVAVDLMQRRSRAAPGQTTRT